MDLMFTLADENLQRGEVRRNWLVGYGIVGIKIIFDPGIMDLKGAKAGKIGK